jgi:hypothetical protein
MADAALSNGTEVISIEKNSTEETEVVKLEETEPENTKLEVSNTQSENTIYIRILIPILLL